MAESSAIHGDRSVSEAVFRYRAESVDHRRGLRIVEIRQRLRCNGTCAVKLVAECLVEQQPAWRNRACDFRIAAERDLASVLHAVAVGVHVVAVCRQVFLLQVGEAVAVRIHD